MRSRTANWIICKIRYEKTGEDGLQKKVTETYVVDALTFTEAEARITEEMASYISGEFKIMNIDPAPFAEIFFASLFIRFFKHIFKLKTDCFYKNSNLSDNTLLSLYPTVITF